MTDVPMSLIEIEERIRVLRENLGQLVEEGAAYSGAADEERMSERIAELEAQLRYLTGLRDKLLQATPDPSKA